MQGRSVAELCISLADAGALQSSQNARTPIYRFTGAAAIVLGQMVSMAAAIQFNKKYIERNERGFPPRVARP